MTDIVISYQGKNYRLIEDAVLTNYQCRAVYEANAIVEDAPQDEYGYLPAYTLRWELPEMNVDDDCDMADLIDWDKPDDVEPYGNSGNAYHYNVATGRLC